MERDALSGHAKPILTMLEKCLDEKNFIEAYRWNFRFRIRVRQDVACTPDKSTGAAANQITIMQMQNPEKFMELPQLSEEESKKMYLEEIVWVETLLQEDKLPSPEWIAEYGMGKFIAAFGGEGAKYIPKEFWKKKRQQALNNIRKQLAK